MLYQILGLYLLPKYSALLFCRLGTAYLIFFNFIFSSTFLVQQWSWSRLRYAHLTREFTRVPLGVEFFLKVWSGRDDWMAPRFLSSVTSPDRESASCPHLPIVVDIFAHRFDRSCLNTPLCLCSLIGVGGEAKTHRLLHANVCDTFALPWVQTFTRRGCKNSERSRILLASALRVLLWWRRTLRWGWKV